MKHTPLKPRVSDKAVYSATGKKWEQWFEQLDLAGAHEWNHKTIARHVLDNFDVKHWWAQTVAVSYEQARGLRDKHEMPDGYQIQREKRINVSVETAWERWRDSALPDQWLAELNQAQIRSVREDKFLVRLDWPDGTLVLIGFQSKGNEKCAIGIQHSKLSDAQAAEWAKAFWSQKLTELKTILEDS